MVIKSRLYCLLLGGGFAQGVPRIATIFWSIVLPIWVLIIPDSSARALRQQPAETSGSETGETWREMIENFAYEVSLAYFWGFFNMP
jgi:hypothetical protein